jgi:hypothetical protein
MVHGLLHLVVMTIKPTNKSDRREREREIFHWFAPGAILSSDGRRSQALFNGIRRGTVAFGRSGFALFAGNLHVGRKISAALLRPAGSFATSQIQRIGTSLHLSDCPTWPWPVGQVGESDSTRG